MAHSQALGLPADTYRWQGGNKLAGRVSSIEVSHTPLRKEVRGLIT